jgi:hypothetical protein
MADELNRQPLTDDERELSNLMRDAAFRLTGAHESREHQGHACAWTRVGVIAYLAHSLGVSSTHLPRLQEAIAQYERDCPCGVPTLDEESFNRPHPRG